MEPYLPLVFLYVDPGIGFVILQTLVGALLGLMFYFRRAIQTMLGRLRVYLKRKRKIGISAEDSE